MQLPERDVYLRFVAEMAISDLIIGVRCYNGLFQELQETGEFDQRRQTQVKKGLREYEQEDKEFKSLRDELNQLNAFKEKYPDSIWNEDVQERITKLELSEEAKRKLRIKEILKSPNSVRPGEIRKLFSKIEDLEDLCSQVGIETKHVLNYSDSQLQFTDLLPTTQNDIPAGYTDIFFWGIPSSGKTCALAAMMYTMDKKYAFTNPNIPVSYGAAYRHSLIRIFRDDVGYLPSRTKTDRTQYMPFELKRRRGNEGFRRVSFFELSGELFEYIYDLENGTNYVSGEKLTAIKNAWKSLNIVLGSDNKKMHVFFIDYDPHKGSFDIDQKDYLSSAASYFANKLDIFKNKTSAIYLIVTKADKIKSHNKQEEANRFLEKDYGVFMEHIRSLAKKHNISRKVKLFSIGDVYFQSICRVSTKYTENIIETLLARIKPDDESYLGKVKRWLRTL
jgi:GTP-binding protein EngB required for normal cell division